MIKDLDIAKSALNSYVYDIKWQHYYKHTRHSTRFARITYLFIYFFEIINPGRTVGHNMATKCRIL